MKKLLVIGLTCITFLLAGCTKTVATNYSGYDLSDINSIPKATKAFQKEFDKKRGTKEAEAGYLKFFDFYFDVVSRQYELIKLEIPSTVAPTESAYLQQKQEYTDEYYRYGLKVISDYDYDFSVGLSDKYLYQNFCPYLTEDWCELLKFESELEKKKPLINDARYHISKSELAEIIKFYENFYKKYPNFVNRNGIKSTLEGYREHLNLKNFPYLY